jgi:hypothetical protein
VACLIVTGFCETVADTNRPNFIKERAAMIVEVEMLAFGEPGEIRKVEIPHDNLDRITVLDSVFHYGQNDFQPQNHPSVSAGDVIRYNGEHYLVAGMGFRKLTNDQLARYRSLDQRDRFIDAPRA